MLPVILDGVYADELISATELNRQSGRILDRALEHPVTITRSEQHFALLKRDDVAQIISAARLSKEALGVLIIAVSLLSGRTVEANHVYGWLSVFDRDELHEFVREILEAYQSPDLSRDSLDSISVIIHEWHESSLAIASPVLADAFGVNAETDELPLTKPIFECAV